MDVSCRNPENGFILKCQQWDSRCDVKTGRGKSNTIEAYRFHPSLEKRRRPCLPLEAAYAKEMDKLERWRKKERK